MKVEQKVVDAQFPAQLSDRQLGAAVESLLFVSGRPLERSELRKLCRMNKAMMLEG